MKPTTSLYTQFDGEEIDGKRYALGDEIDADTNSAAVALLVAQGRLSGNRPSATTDAAIDTGKSVGDMSRSELEGAALSAFSANMANATDDELRNAVERQREALADSAGEGEGKSDAKPLKSQTTAELEATASAEGVTFGDDVKTNPDRVKAIEEARAKSNG